jgi:predicted kinase
MSEEWLILVTGEPASGKSTLARSIAQRLRCALLAKDAVKEPLMDVLGAPDRGASRRLSDASFAVLFALAAELRAAAQCVVLEGNFRPGEHEERLRALAAGARFVQVLCCAPAPLRRERLAARAADPRRHAGHADRVLIEEPSASGFLDLPGDRIRYDSAAPGGASALIETLFGQED